MFQKVYIFIHEQKIKFITLSIVNIFYVAFSIINDFHFFVFENEFNAHTYGLYFVIKFFWIISVGVIEYLVYLAFTSREKIFNKYGILFTVNTIIYGIIFIALFPGNWGGVGDELLIYWAAKHMWIWPQQGAMSGLVMIWQLMFYPATWMPVLIQVLFTDIVFTRITGKLWSRDNKITAIIFEVVMFSAVAVIYAYNPMRMWVLTVTLLAFLAEFYFAWSEKKFSGLQQIYMCFLLCIIVCIRTETKYMLIWAPILFILLLKRCEIRAWKKIIAKMEMIIIFSVFVLSAVFDNLGGTAYKYNSLGVVSFVCPLSEILASDDANLAGLEKEITAINNVFPVQDLIDNPSSTNFWNFQHWIDDYEDASKNEIIAFQSAALKIIGRNLNIFIKSRCKMLEECMPKGEIFTARNIEEIKNWCEANHSTSTNLYKDFDFKNPMRMIFASALSGRLYMPLLVRNIQYSFKIPIILLIIAFAVALFKKNDVMILILSTAGIEFVLMFLLIPNSAYMYYVPFYMLGWGMFGGFIDKRLQNVKERLNKA